LTRKRPLVLDGPDQVISFVGFLAL
jgi:hypothetical protein